MRNLLLLFAFAGIVIGHPNGGIGEDRVEPGRADMSAGARICAIVGIQTIQGAYPRSVSALLVQRDPRQELVFTADSCRGVVREVNSTGISPSSMQDVLSGHVRIGRSANREIAGALQQRFGLPDAQRKLVDFLVRQAKGEGNAPASTRREYAKAAIGVSVLSRTGGSAQQLAMLLRDREFLAVLNLNERQVQELDGIANELLMTGLEQPVQAVYSALDSLITRDASSPIVETCDLMLSNLENAWHLTRERIDIRFLMARTAWRAKCLLAADGHEVLLQSLIARVKQIESATTCPHSRRWLREAIQVPGPRPESSGRKVVEGAHDFKPGSP